MACSSHIHVWFLFSPLTISVSRQIYYIQTHKLSNAFISNLAASSGKIFPPKMALSQKEKEKKTGKKERQRKKWWIIWRDLVLRLSFFFLKKNPSCLSKKEQITNLKWQALLGQERQFKCGAINMVMGLEEISFKTERHDHFPPEQSHPCIKCRIEKACLLSLGMGAPHVSDQSPKYPYGHFGVQRWVHLDLGKMRSRQGPRFSGGPSVTGGGPFSPFCLLPLKAMAIPDLHPETPSAMARSIWNLNLSIR